jgi:hypothetical protein
VVIFNQKIVASEASKIPDLISMGLIEIDNSIDTCPRCHHSTYDVYRGDLRRQIKILNGPYTRYQRRDHDLFFDLKKKYYTCIHCCHEIFVLDIQVLIDTVSRKLPPADARRFSMKMMGKYRLDPKSIREVVPLFVDDFELSKDEPYVI